MESLSNEQELLSVVYVGDDAAALRELTRLAELVGVSVHHVHEKQIERAVLRFSSIGMPEGQVRASFHHLFASYFGPQRLSFNYREDSAEILELMVAVGATERGKVVGVVGAQGGIGASALSAWIARTFAKSHEHVALMDLDPASAGIELLLASVDQAGKRWADLHGVGSLLARRLTDALPEWHGVRFLSADARGGVSTSTDAGVTAISALSQVNEWSVLDLPSVAMRRDSLARSWLEWCDHVLVLTRADSISLAGAHTKLEWIAQSVPHTVAVVDVTSKNEAAHAAQMLGQDGVLTVRRDRGFVAGLDHGVWPGERSRASSAKDVARVCAYLEEVVR